MAKVNVYDDNHNIVAMVEYNDKLDFWDGRNWTSGGAGHHLGITKLKDGSWVLIHGSQWQGSRDYGEIVTPEEALQAILRNGHEDLLEGKRFAPLLTIQKNMVEEDEEA
jgi:hypothetical protein